MNLHPLFALVLVAVAPAAAQETTSPAPKPVKARKVCRQVVPTGSIMSRPMCLTAGEWTEFQGVNSRRVEQATRDRSNSFDTRLPQ